MLEILFIRHGQSVGNIKGVFCGSCDYELSDMGKKQGGVVCDYIYNNYNVQALYSSALKRANQTLDRLSLLLNKKVVKLTEFNELYGGKWEDQTIPYIKEHFAKEYEKWLTDVGEATPTGGENFDSLYERVKAGIEIIAKECDGKDGVVVVATHGGVIRVLETKLKNLPNSEMQNIPWVSNCSITTIIYDNGNLSLKQVGLDNFLGENKTFIAKGL